MHTETSKRSFVKTITWRIIATLITWGVIYAYMDRVSESLAITLIAAFLSMTAYYIHERIWNKINWEKN